MTSTWQLCRGKFRGAGLGESLDSDPPPTSPSPNESALRSYVLCTLRKYRLFYVKSMFPPGKAACSPPKSAGYPDLAHASPSPVTRGSYPDSCPPGRVGTRDSFLRRVRVGTHVYNCVVFLGNWGTNSPPFMILGIHVRCK